jgi:hypothetical protein
LFLQASSNSLTNSYYTDIRHHDCSNSPWRYFLRYAQEELHRCACERRGQDLDDRVLRSSGGSLGVIRSVVFLYSGSRCDDTAWLLMVLLVDVLGSTAFKPVKSDMSGNIKVGNSHGKNVEEQAANKHARKSVTANSRLQRFQKPCKTSPSTNSRRRSTSPQKVSYG